MVRPRLKNKIKQAGFTLVELLVTITIFVVLTGVVLFSQERFNSTIFLTNLSYDIALTLRQAQTYGINIKGFVSGADDNYTSEFLPYGVNFNTDHPRSFILFADINATQSTDTKRWQTSGMFSDGQGEAPDYASCDKEEGCVNRYVIQKGNRISGLCVEASGDECTSVQNVDIVFVRPNPEAKITANRNGGTFYNLARITLSDALGTNLRQVVVRANGVVYVKRNVDVQE